MNSLKPLIQFIAGLCLVALVSCDSKPPLPIKVRQRDSRWSSGKVAIFTNTSMRTLSVAVYFKNPTFGRHKAFALVLKPGETTEFGGFDGWNGIPGDSVTLESHGYADGGYTFID